MKKISFSTKEQYQIIDITDEVKNIAEKSGVKEGICNVYAPHATASIILNENYDPNVMKDILQHLSEAIKEGRWLHDAVDGNGAAHIKSALVGPSETIPITNGKLALGTWQNVMFCEFDGPKKRDVYVTIIKSE